MNNQKIATWLEKILLFLLFLSPFVVLLVDNGIGLSPINIPLIDGNLFFPYITTKAFLFRFIVELAFGLWLVLLCLNKNYLPKRSPIVIAATIFVAIIALADFFGVDWYNSVWSSFERMEGLISLVHLWLYIILLDSFIKTEKLWNYFLHTITAASVATGFYGWYQLTGRVEISQGSTRLDSTLGNSAYLGTYMSMTLFITLYLWWRSKKDWLSNTCYGLVALSQLGVLYYSGTRGAMLGVVIGFLAMFFLLATNKVVNTKVRLVSVCLLVSLVLTIGGFYMARETALVQSSPILERLANLSLEDKTVRSRLMVWSMALEGFKEKPILGWGQDNFADVFGKYYNPKMYDQEPWFDHTHNILFDWLVAGGLLGLLGYLSLYLVSLWNIWRSQKFDIYTKIILASFMVSYFFQNLVIFDNITSYITFAALMVFINFSCKDDNTEKDKNKIDKNNHKLPQTLWATLFLLPLLFFVIYYVNLKPMLANLATIGGIRAVGEGTVEASLNDFKKALSYETFGTLEISQQLAEVAIKIIGNKDVSEGLKIESFNLVNQTLTDILIRDPNDIRTIIIYANLLMQVGKFSEAEEYINRALLLSPNKQQILLAKISILLSQNKPKDALVVAKQTFDLEPSNEEARKIYALVASYNGEEKLYQSLIKPILDPKWQVVPDDRFTLLYSERGEYDKLINFWQMRIEQNPSDIELRMKLAGSLYGAGQINESIKVLQKATVDFPQYTDQIKIYIDGVRSRTIKIQ